MIENWITKTWAQTGKKTELKRRSYEENSFVNKLPTVAYGSDSSLRFRGYGNQV
ncbi:hypothetical protein HanPSC8_Chr13g0559101 [Helianthus annuus]|nr:hypothetical protein HanPSC8_Chr13g0559101 [Helianthus annuus]